jgi:hypothetical protein
VLHSDETRLSTASVTQQLVEGNEVVRKEMIKKPSTEPTVTCRTGPTMRIQRNVTQRKNGTRNLGGQKNFILSWGEPSTGVGMKKNSHAVSVSRRLLLGAYRRFKHNKISTVQPTDAQIVKKGTDCMLHKNIDFCA